MTKPSLPPVRELTIGQLAELTAYLHDALRYAADDWGTPSDDPEIDRRAVSHDLDRALADHDLENLAAQLRLIAQKLEAGEYGLVRESDVRPARPDVVRTGRW